MRTAVKSALAAAACTAAPCSAAQVEQVEQDRAAPAKEAKMKPSTPSSGVANLPFARGRTFGSLDEYLAHLERYAGPVGQPWYRKVWPDRYERVTTVRSLDGRGQPETFTREQLMREYGFTH